MKHTLERILLTMVAFFTASTRATLCLQLEEFALRLNHDRDGVCPVALEKFKKQSA